MHPASHFESSSMRERPIELLPGQYFDQETNLTYNYFRDFDSSIGRYIQSDPIGLEGGVDTYAYVKNKPLSLVDLNGLQACGPPPKCHTFKTCHYDGGLYDQKCSDGRPKFYVCTFFSDCPPFVWGTRVIRCGTSGGGPRG